MKEKELQKRHLYLQENKGFIKHGIANFAMRIFRFKGVTPGVFVKAHSKGLTRHNVCKCIILKACGDGILVTVTGQGWIRMRQSGTRRVGTGLHD